MRIEPVTHETELAFFQCLHTEQEPDWQIIELRRRWYEKHLTRGLRARIVRDDNRAIVGMFQTMPVEQSFIQGEDLLAILCIWIHGYEHGVGNQQNKGYGKIALAEIEQDARESGLKGVVAWGMDFQEWNPISWYEKQDYQRVDQEGMVVLAWKPFSDNAKPPRLLRQRKEVPTRDEKASLTVFINGWCRVGCGDCVIARRVAGEMGRDQVVYLEIHTSNPQVMRRWGISDGVFLDGEPVYPYGPPWDSTELKRLIAKRQQARQEGQVVE